MQKLSIREKIIQDSIIILDGGTGTEIQRLGGVMSSAWGALANIESPDVVINVHENHIKAGCEIITTNTFSTCRHALDAIGKGDQTEAINSEAVKLAREAIRNMDAEHKVYIAGSMSNFFSLLTNEFRPDPQFVPDAKTEQKNYKELAKILADSGVDLLILELLVDIDHSKILLEAAMETGLPVWVGLSCCKNKNDGSIVGRNFSVENIKSLIYDEDEFPEAPKLLPEDKIIPLKDIILSLKAVGGDVYGIMHSWFEDSKAGLEILKENWDGPIMFYPEIMLFDTSTGGAQITSTEKEFAESCQKLIDNRIKVIGGCCGVSDKHLNALVKKISP